MLAGYAVPALAQDHAVGEWHGDLVTPGGKFTLLIRINRGSSGTLSGDFESLSQAPGQKIPLGAIEASDSQLRFRVPSIGASVDATWSEKDQAWTGQYQQGVSLALTLQRGAPAPEKIVAGLDGQWSGKLKRNDRDLRLILHVTTDKLGTHVRLDSPDLGAYDLPVDQFEHNGRAIRFHIPAVGAQFSGQLDDAQQSFGGTWSRPGQPDTDVNFKRDAAQTSQHLRSQWPLPPASYSSQDVSIPNALASGVVLTCTLSEPHGPGSGLGLFPAAILITGSGAQDRDETMYGHKPFAVLADFLTRHGIAVLRCDDRGFAASTGNFDQSTSADFATDANAAFSFLRNRPEINGQAIGFVGHSEGGMIGQIAAASNHDAAFLVMLAGPGTDTEKLILSQRRAEGLSQGFSPEAINHSEPVVRELIRMVQNGAPGRDLKTDLDKALTPDALAAIGVQPGQRDAVVAEFSGPWMRYFIKYHPDENLRRLRIPVLALDGSLDQQVPAAENLAAIRRALSANADATVVELPGLNHMFQTAHTGALGEYADLEETFAPAAMTLIADWINQRFPAKHA
jgi:hypothetical protein